MSTGIPGPAVAMVLAAGLAACGTGTGTTDAGRLEATELAGQGRDAGPPPSMPAWDDGAGIVTFLGEVAAWCPPVTEATAPPEWNAWHDPVGGCRYRVPAGWEHLVPGFSTARFRDPASDAGYYLTTGSPGSLVDLDTGIQILRAGLQSEWPDLEVLSEESSEDAWEPGGHRIRRAIVRFHQGGVPMVGWLRVVIPGCTAGCVAASSAAWAPVAGPPELFCTLFQADAAFTCGGGPGACQDAACDEACRGGGHAFGYCTAGACACA
jgi:hypothetical protein